MSNSVSYRALIRGIEKLYFKVSLIVLHQRMDSYHSKISLNHAPYEQDIKTPLMEFIETTIAYAVKVENSDYRNDSTLNQSRHATIQPLPPLSQHHEINPQHVGELSRYFKTRINGDELHPAIKDKLEHSVWEHIHATTRCARQCDKRNAKLHLNIANSACRELAHYMNDKEHLAFTAEVATYMAALKVCPEIDNDE